MNYTDLLSTPYSVNDKNNKYPPIFISIENLYMQDENERVFLGCNLTKEPQDEKQQRTTYAEVTFILILHVRMARFLPLPNTSSLLSDKPNLESNILVHSQCRTLSMYCLMCSCHIRIEVHELLPLDNHRIHNKHNSIRQCK